MTRNSNNYSCWKQILNELHRTFSDKVDKVLIWLSYELSLITSQYLSLMPISDDNRPAQRVELSFLSVTVESPVMDAIKSYMWILWPKNAYMLDSRKTILHFTHSRHSIIDNKVQIMGCTMYVKCERLLFMNKLLNPAICATHCACAVIAALIKRSYQYP